jgi:peptidoglycan/LPS O-acetylase OafA/YrhL
MLGAQIALGQGERWETLRHRTPWIPFSLVLLGVVAYKCGQSVDSPGRLMDLLIALASMALLIVCTRSETDRVRTFLEIKPLVWIGAFSYSIYLIHAPLLQVCWQYGLHPLGLSALDIFGLLATAGTALIVLISYGFFWFCERPFLPDNVPGRTQSFASQVDRTTVAQG